MSVSESPLASVLDQVDSPGRLVSLGVRGPGTGPMVSQVSAAAPRPRASRQRELASSSSNFIALQHGLCPCASAAPPLSASHPALPPRNRTLGPAAMLSTGSTQPVR
eukprot:3574906-Rhodomonas_salina.1